MPDPDHRQQGQLLARGVRLGRADGPPDALLRTDETDELRGDGVEHRAPDRDPARRDDPAIGRRAPRRCRGGRSRRPRPRAPGDRRRRSPRRRRMRAPRPPPERTARRPPWPAPPVARPGRARRGARQRAGRAVRCTRPRSGPALRHRQLGEQPRPRIRDRHPQPCGAELDRHPVHGGPAPFGLGRDPGELDMAVAAPAVDERGPARGQRPGSDGSEQHPLVRAAVHHQTGDRELPQPAEQRVEQRACRSAAAPGEDHVQPDVLGLRQELDERQQRVGRAPARRGDEVVVVDEHDDLGAAPPAPRAQLARADIGAREPGAQRRRDVPGGLRRGIGRAGVGDQVRRGNRSEQAPAVVDDHDPQLVRRVPPDEAAHEHPEQRGLAALGVREAEQVRVGGEVHADPGETLLDRRRSGRRRARGPDRRPGRRPGGPGPGAATPAGTGCRSTRRRSRPRARRCRRRPPQAARADNHGAATTIGAPLASNPWPGRAGTAAARRRSISDSAGSPSRSSMRLPRRSLTAGRSSLHRFADTTRCRP